MKREEKIEVVEGILFKYAHKNKKIPLGHEINVSYGDFMNCAVEIVDAIDIIKKQSGGRI